MVLTLKLRETSMLPPRVLIRSLHGVDPKDDDHEIWIELSIKSIDVVGASDDEEGGNS